MPYWLWISGAVVVALVGFGWFVFVGQGLDRQPRR